MACSVLQCFLLSCTVCDRIFLLPYLQDAFFSWTCDRIWYLALVPLISLLIQMIWDFLQSVFSAPAWIYLITVGSDRTFFIGFLSFALGFQSPNYPDKMCLFEGVKVLLVLLKLGPLSVCQFRLITTVHLQLAVFVQFNWPRANSGSFLFLLERQTRQISQPCDNQGIKRAFSVVIFKGTDTKQRQVFTCLTYELGSGGREGVRFQSLPCLLVIIVSAFA